MPDGAGGDRPQWGRWSSGDPSDGGENRPVGVGASRSSRSGEQSGTGFAMPETPAPTSSSASGFLVDALRRRKAGRRLLSALTALLFLGGAGMFAYPFFTDLYTEQVVQQRLEDEYVRIQADVSSVEEWEQNVKGQDGRALTRIIIPKLGVDTLVVEGTSSAALRAGAGHYPDTPLPGQAGNVAIAGHRTTYGKPFNRLDELGPGDEVWLLTPVGDYRYVVGEAPPGWNANPYITHPKDWSVVKETETPSLTLTTCHPKGSARQRLVLRATLAASEPPGTYGSGPAA